MRCKRCSEEAERLARVKVTTDGAETLTAEVCADCLDDLRTAHHEWFYGQRTVKRGPAPGPVDTQES